MAQKWEYALVKFNWNTKEEVLLEEVSAKAEEGWELVTAYYRAVPLLGYAHHYWFRRPVE